MEDHIVLRVDQLVSNKLMHSSQSVEVADASCSHVTVSDMKDDVEFDAAGEEEPLIQSVECRICQDEDTIKNMEVPCACSGSLKVLFFQVCCFFLGLCCWCLDLRLELFI